MHNMKVPSFKDYFLLREEEEGSSSSSDGDNPSGKRDWKKEYIQLEKGFVPPPKLRPVIEAFLDSGDIKIMDDTSKEIKMPKKSLYLVGGAVRDFLTGKTPRNYNLSTDATPEQVALILHKAGFRIPSEGYDRTEIGKNRPLKLSFEPKEANKGWKKLWYIDGRDKSKDSKAYSVTAEVDGEKFVIETFRRDPKTGQCPDSAEFVPGADEDSKCRDFTINAMYIELSKPDGPNNKLHDPTNKGWHDVKHGTVRAVGKAEDRLKEDPGRALRGIRLHSRMGKNQKLDSDIEKAISNMGDFDNIDLSRIKDEFLLGLQNPDTDLGSMLGLFKKTGLLDELLPGLEHDIEFPSNFEKRDKPLAMAWILRNNDPENIKSVLTPSRKRGDKDAETGWTDSERRSIMFLLDLLGFTPEKRPSMQKNRKLSGLSKDQIRQWVDMFNLTDKMGRIRNRRPGWAQLVKAFAKHEKPLASEDDLGNLGLHPAMLDPEELEDILSQLEIDKFMDLLPKNESVDYSEGHSETPEERWQRKKAKHPKDYKSGKDGYVGGNPRYGKSGNTNLKDINNPKKNRGFRSRDEGKM